MLENIVRHVEKGDSPLEAALKGSREIGFTILAMTISLVAVLVPILFMGGILGRLLNEFAVTIGAAILVSCFVSLSLTPMHTSRFLRSGEKKPPRSFGFFEGTLRLYEKALAFVLRHQKAGLFFTWGLVLVTAGLFVLVPKGLIPVEDIDQISGSTEAIQGISFPDMIKHQQAIARILEQDPNIAGLVSSVGSGGRNSGGNSGSFVIRLKPRSQRRLDSEAIIKGLRPKFAKVPGIKVFLQTPPSIRIGGQSSKSLYQLTLKGTVLSELYKATPLLEERMRDLPELLDVTSDLEASNPVLKVEIDRERASALGVTAQQVESTLGNAYGTRQVSQIYRPTNQYVVILEIDPKYQDPASLSLLYVRSSLGNLVPIGSIASFTQEVGPAKVTHLDQSPSTTLSFNLKPGVSLGQATAMINKLAYETLPSSVQVTFQGSAKLFESSVGGLGWLLLLAVGVIYLVLGILYESFIHPLTVLSGLPSAAAGALLTLLSFGMELNLYGFVGLIMLIGIVKKNAIILIDFALGLQKEGESATVAIHQACLVRFRPIMMTTMAALAGALPIALGLGAGGEARQSLGLVVFGGLLVSQLLTLFLTPVVFIALDSLGKKKPSPGLFISPKEVSPL